VFIGSHSRSEDHSESMQDASTSPFARSAQRADERGGAAVLRLDKRTYLDREQGRLSVTLRDYGDGLCEVGWSFVAAMGLSKSTRGESENRFLHADRAARRARSRLRQLILASKADHLLTLTYRENIAVFRQTSEDLSRFVRIVKKVLPDWLYIAVPEKQKRGAWHWHIAVVGRQNIELLRASWRQVVGGGNIDVQPPKRGKSNRRLGIVKYLGKYLAKGFAEDHRELNGHRYRASLGIAIPGESIAVPASFRGEASRYIVEQLRKRAGNVGFVWVDQNYGAGWACSWE